MIVFKAKNSEGVLINRVFGLLGLTSGVFDHVRSLGRVKLSFGHLARDYSTHVRRHQIRTGFVADINHRQSEIPNRFVTCTVSEFSKLILRGIYLFSPSSPQLCRSSRLLCDRM